jgi:uncharacterized membrane protein
MPAYAHTPSPPQPSDGLYAGALATYIVGLFVFVPHLVSLILTFIMVSKGYVHGGRKAVGKSGGRRERGERRRGEPYCTTVLSLAIIELITWLFCAAFSWYYVPCNYNFYYDCMSYYGWVSTHIFFLLLFYYLIFFFFSSNSYFTQIDCNSDMVGGSTVVRHSSSYLLEEPTVKFYVFVNYFMMPLLILFL